MIKLISYQEVSKAVNIKLQMRRLNTYSLDKLIELYFYEKNKVLELHKEIEKVYDVNKLNFAFEFHLNGSYVEHCQFIGKKPLKQEVIERIILFLETKYFIEQYRMNIY